MHLGAHTSADTLIESPVLSRDSCEASHMTADLGLRSPETNHSGLQRRASAGLCGATHTRTRFGPRDGPAVVHLHTNREFGS